MTMTNDDKNTQEHKMTNQTDTESTERTVTIDAKYFYALMRIVGQQIDPATCEVDWTYAQTLDPYGVHPDLPEEAQQVGREHFARNPGSDIWVSFHDLPEVTLNALRHKEQPSFTVKDGRLHWNVPAELLELFGE
jgi:hypothetical protein